MTTRSYIDLCPRQVRALEEKIDGPAISVGRQFLLQEHRMVVLHGSAYGPGGEGLLRVSFAAGGQRRAGELICVHLRLDFGT